MTWANESDVLGQLSASGLQVDVLEVGKIVRVAVEGDRHRQKSGWYSLHEIPGRDGGTLLVGAYGSWREGGGHHKIELGKSSEALSTEEKTAIRARIAADRKEAARRREREAGRAAQVAERAWKACTPDGTCDYLRRKGVLAHGARFSPKGNLVIPLCDSLGRIRGLQVIYGDPDHKTRRGRDKDYWPAGLAKQGHWFQIGTPVWIVLLVEGFATGASLHQATGLPVAVAFDAGNLVPVALALRKTYPNIQVLACADDDFLTPGNPGITAAGAAALAASGSWVAPAFADRGERKLTDFNDLAQSQGLHVVRAQIEARIQELGWRARPPTTGGEGGAGRFDLPVLLDRYALIYTTETVFDGERHKIVNLSALRAAAGKGLVRAWLEHVDRVLVEPEQVGFDPTGATGLRCNLWSGWPTQPRAGSCERLLELLAYLCSREPNSAELYRWILCWLAYPIQHPGAKMQTALLIHGPEGTGKNTFFSVVRQIYGHYGCQFSQDELESQFNGWASGRLFGIGNEVVTRAERYHQQGRLKTMITEPEWMINEKNLPVRQEQNHCNFVFFSNRIDIAQLDRGDRRYCVVWTPPALGADFYAEVGQEIQAGGVEALHDYLIHLDLGDFNDHTKPPMTGAKEDLIDLGKESTDRFWDAWVAGELPGLPCRPCHTEDLYKAYRAWVTRVGISKAAPLHVLLAGLGKKPGAHKRRVTIRDRLLNLQKVMVLFPPGQTEPPPGRTLIDWLSAEIQAFAEDLDYHINGPQPL